MGKIRLTVIGVCCVFDSDALGTLVLAVDNVVEVECDVKLFTEVGGTVKAFDVTVAVVDGDVGLFELDIDEFVFVQSVGMCDRACIGGRSKSTVILSVLFDRGETVLTGSVTMILWDEDTV